MNIFTDIKSLSFYNAAMPIHIAKTYLNKDIKLSVEVEPTDTFPVNYTALVTDPDSATIREVGCFLLVHCPGTDDKGEVLACERPDELPFDEQALDDLYRIQRRVVAPDGEPNEYFAVVFGKVPFFARKLRDQSGVFDLLIQHGS